MSGTTPEERKAYKDKRREWNKARHAAGEVALKPKDTPAGTKQRVQLFKEMLMSEPVGQSIIRKIIDVARNDEHPGQMAALKMCIDRMLPTSLFEEKANGQRTSIQITIGRVGEEQNVTIDQNPEDN